VSDEIDYSNLPDFPKRIAEKLKTIRKRLAMSADQIAPRVGAKSGAEILSYENDEGELPVSVLWAYARLAGNPMMNRIDDDLEVNWSNN
jgi:transcriptional regulator with XRE-family HTH domain